MKEQRYIKTKRKGKVFFLVLGSILSILMGSVACSYPGRYGIDAGFIVLVLFLVFGIWMILYSVGESLRLDLQRNELIIRGIFRKKKKIAISEICYFEKTKNEIYFYNDTYQCIGIVDNRRMRGTEEILQRISTLNAGDELVFDRKKRWQFCDGKGMNNVLIIIFISVALVGIFFILVCSSNTTIQICMDIIAFCLIGSISYKIRREKRQYWFPVHNGLMYQNGRKQKFYADQEITGAQDVGTFGKQKMSVYQVFWRTGESASFIQSKEVDEWLLKNGYTEKMMQEAGRMAQVKEEEREMREGTPRWLYTENGIRVVRMLTWLIGIGTLAMMFAVDTLAITEKQKHIIYAILPLLNYILPCLCPAIFYMVKPKYATENFKKRHIMFPFIFMLIEMVLATISVEGIDTETVERYVLFYGIIFIITTGTMMISILPRKGDKFAVACFCFFMAVQSVPQTNALVWAYTEGMPTYEEAHIIKKEISKGRTTAYLLTIKSEKGTVKEVGVSSSDYEKRKEGEALAICHRKSLLGIEYSLYFFKQ